MRSANWDPDFDGEPLDGPIVARGYDPAQPRNHVSRNDFFDLEDEPVRGRPLTRKPGRRAPPAADRRHHHHHSPVVTYPTPTGTPLTGDSKSELCDIWAVMYVVIWHVKTRGDVVLSAAAHAGNASYFTIQPKIRQLCKTLFPVFQVSSATGLVALMYLFRLKTLVTHRHCGWTDVADVELATIVVLLADMWMNDNNFSPISFTNFTGIPLGRVLALKRRALDALGTDLRVPEEIFAAFKALVDDDLRAFQLERDAFAEALVACGAVSPKGPPAPGQSGRRDSGCSLDPALAANHVVAASGPGPVAAADRHQTAVGDYQQQAAHHHHRHHHHHHHHLDAHRRILREAELLQKQIAEHQAWLREEGRRRCGLFQNQNQAAVLVNQQIPDPRREREAAGIRMGQFVSGARKPQHQQHAAAAAAAAAAERVAHRRVGEAARPADTKKIWTDELRRAFEPAPYDTGAHPHQQGGDPSAAKIQHIRPSASAAAAADDDDAEPVGVNKHEQPAAAAAPFAARTGVSPPSRDKTAFAAAAATKQQPNRGKGEHLWWFSAGGGGYVTAAEVGRAIAAAAQRNYQQHQQLQTLRAIQALHKRQSAVFPSFPWSCGASVPFAGGAYGYGQPWISYPWSCGTGIPVTGEYCGYAQPWTS